MRLLVVECDAALALRATAQWDARRRGAAAPTRRSASSRADRAHGRLAITLDPRDGGPIYQGIVALEAGSIATLIEHYLATSEQIDSRLVLAATDDGVRGLLLQRLPGAQCRGRRRLAGSGRGARRRVARRRAARRPATPGPLLQALFPEDDLRLFAPQPARFACRCSSERVANALRLVGRAEVESIVAEQGAVGDALRILQPPLRVRRRRGARAVRRRRRPATRH